MFRLTEETKVDLSSHCFGNGKEKKYLFTNFQPDVFLRPILQLCLQLGGGRQEWGLLNVGGGNFDLPKSAKVHFFQTNYSRLS